MKVTLVLYILLNLIFFCFSIVPIWDLKKSSIDLLSDSNKIEYTMEDTELHYKLRYIFRKIIKKENNSVKVINHFTCQFTDDQNNNLVVNQIVDFDEIESAYTDKKGKYYICPKGSHHVHYFQDGDANLSILKHMEFENDSSEWELKCYQQHEKNTDASSAWKKLFVFYLNKNEYIYQIDENSKTMTIPYDYKVNILNFRWTTVDIDNIYTMYAINAYDKEVFIEQMDFTITSTETSVGIKSNALLFKLPKSNTIANLNIDSENSRFYYISYDEDSINITSGYTDNLYTISKAKYFKVNHNEKSPFEFFDNVKLKNIRFISGTKYAYYNLYDEIQNKSYYGILDVELNQVIYNTDEELVNFEVYSTTSMLAVTSSSAYQICVITSNNKCIDSCPNKIILDVENGNKCGDSYDCSQYILIPNNICIYACDSNLLYLDKNNQCGLCKDFQINKPYKMLNYSGCLEEKIDNTYYVNEELLLISCNENYSYIDEECKLTNCYETCEICSEKSTISTDQKCLSCKKDFPILYQNNCLKNCPEKTYQNKNTCEECQDICETCDKNGCTNCPDGYYLNSDNHTCELCHEKCETCSAKGTDENNNCLKCKNPNDMREDGNCKTICGERQYKTKRNTCESCMTICASCRNGDSCESCFINYYLDNKNCYICQENCYNCTKGGNKTHHNCLSCKNNNHYLVTGGEYENNCVETCPEDTVKDENHKICTYIPPINTDKDEGETEEEEEKREIEEEEEEEKKEHEKTGKVIEKEKENEKEIVSSVNLDLIVWIFTFGTAFFLILINIIFFSKNCCCKGKQEDVTETIQTELSEMNLIIN